MNRDSLVFYRSFAESIKELPEEKQLAALWAVIDYGLDGSEPTDAEARALWRMAKPLIDANHKRYENAKKGGRPKNETTPLKKCAGFNNSTPRAYDAKALEIELLKTN